jgi:hypothetical protein
MLKNCSIFFVLCSENKNINKQLKIYKILLKIKCIKTVSTPLYYIITLFQTHKKKITNRA